MPKRACLRSQGLNVAPRSSARHLALAFPRNADLPIGSVASNCRQGQPHESSEAHCTPARGGGRPPTFPQILTQHTLRHEGPFNVQNRAKTCTLSPLNPLFSSKSFSCRPFLSCARSPKLSTISSISARTKSSNLSTIFLRGEIPEPVEHFLARLPRIYRRSWSARETLDSIEHL
jgi:hypothetical protein